MSTLLVGVLIVIVSSLGLGAAMFGRRPIPQPATHTVGSHPGPVAVPSSVSPDYSTSHVSAADQVTVPASVRVKSGGLLALGVIIMASLLGVALSVVVVGLVMLIS